MSFWKRCHSNSLITGCVKSPNFRPGELESYRISQACKGKCNHLRFSEDRSGFSWIFPMGHPLLEKSRQGRLLFWGSISKSKSCGHQHLLFCQELNEHWTFSWCSLYAAQASNHFCLTTTRFQEMDDGKIGGKPSLLAVKTRVFCVNNPKTMFLAMHRKYPYKLSPSDVSI